MVVRWVFMEEISGKKRDTVDSRDFSQGLLQDLSGPPKP